MTPETLRAALAMAADTFEKIESMTSDMGAVALARNAARAIRALLDTDTPTPDGICIEPGCGRLRVARKTGPPSLRCHGCQRAHRREYLARYNRAYYERRKGSCQS